MKPPEIQYDELNDILTIDGIRFSRAFIDAHTDPPDDDCLYEIKMIDGVVTITRHMIKDYGAGMRGVLFDVQPE